MDVNMQKYRNMYGPILKYTEYVCKYDETYGICMETQRNIKNTYVNIQKYREYVCDYNDI